MARIRSRGDLHVVPAFYVHQIWPAGHVDVSWDTFSYLESMKDISSKSDHLSEAITSWVHPVYHEKWRYFGKDYQNWHGDHGDLVNMSTREVPPYLSVDTFNAMLPSFPDADRNELLLEAFNALSEVWPEPISVAETLQGLTELKSMIPKFTGDIVRDLAALHLNKSFAWDSLVSDLKSFSALTSSIEKRMKTLRDTRGKPTRLHFTRKNILQGALGSSVVLEPYRGWGTKYTLRGFRMEFHAGATLFQLMNHLDDAIGYVRGVVGALGGANPLKQVWNIIPLSFVVDYFFNVSARLDALARVKPEETWELSRVTHSFKSVAVWDVAQTHPHLVDWVEPDQYLGTVVKTTYQRALGLPFDVLSLDIESLNPSQLGLLAALLAGIKRL